MLERAYEVKQILITRHFSLIISLPTLDKESINGLSKLVDDTQHFFLLRGECVTHTRASGELGLCGTLRPRRCPAAGIPIKPLGGRLALDWGRPRILTLTLLGSLPPPPRYRLLPVPFGTMGGINLLHPVHLWRWEG